MQVVRAREPASFNFWPEKVVAVVILLQVLARKSQWQKIEIFNQRLGVLSLCEQPGEGLTSFN